MSKQPRTFLGVTVRQESYIRNVTEVELEHGINAGIRLNIYGGNFIPVYEEHRVRVDNNYSLEQWDDEVPYLDKVMLIAVSRIAHAMKNIQTEAEINESKRKAKR